MNSEQRQVLQENGFITGPEIGKGTYGTVFRCTHADTHVNYAVKVIDLKLLKMRPNFDLEKLLREVHVMQQLNHPNIVRLFSVLQSANYVLLIMELVLGVELFELIMAKNGLKEEEAQPIIYKLVLAIQYMHSKGIIHRDIKPENILLQGGLSVALPAEDGTQAKPNAPGIKLVDFGLSKSLGVEGSGAKSIVGTPRYIAPEITAMSAQDQSERQNYGTAVDCYSTGVLIHVTLGACFPQFVKKNGQDHVVFQDPRIASISDDAKDLISRLMNPNIMERMTMTEAYDHKWFAALKPTVPVPEILRKISARETQPYDEFVETMLKNAPPGRQVIKGANEPQALTKEQLESLHHLQDLQSQYEAMTKQQNVATSPIASTVDRVPPVIRPSIPVTSSNQANHVTVPVPGRSPKSILDAPQRLKRRAATAEIDTAQDGDQIMAETERNSSTSTSGSSSPSVRPSFVSQVLDSISALPAADVTKVDTEDSVKSQSDYTQSHVGEVAGTSGYSANATLTPKRNTGFSFARTHSPSVDGQFSTQEKDEYSQAFVSSMQPNNATAIIDPAQLLSLQCKIAECFRESWDACKDDETVAPAIRSSAVASRDLMQASSWLLKKLEQTSISVSDLLPDLMIAVEEGEFSMAFTCFKTIKGWIGMLKKEATDLLERNLAVMKSVNDSIELARSRHHRLNRVTNALENMVLDQQEQHRKRDSMSNENNQDGFDHDVNSRSDSGRLQSSQLKQLIGVVNEAITSGETLNEDKVLDMEGEPVRMYASPSIDYMEGDDSNYNEPNSASGEPNAHGSLIALQPPHRPGSPSQHMTQALEMLKQVDQLLQHHASFWSQMEVVVDVLMQRAEHIEGMIDFTRNPRLRGRFTQRMNEYEMMWKHVMYLCDRFNTGQNAIVMYKFLN